MVEDEAKPLTPKPMPLELLGVAELEARIAALKAEIAACEAMIAQKQSHRAAADALFGGAKG